MIRAVLGVLLLMLAACGGVPPEARAPAEPVEVSRLAAEILALSPAVDPEEAERAAAITYAATRELAIQYRITDPPLVHNTKVNLGLKPRGLCYHWADDLEARLAEENFQTLSLHRAIANADNAFRIDHSTTIIGAKGEGLFDGIVVDPWRLGGELTWVAVTEDPDYTWVPRDIVMAKKWDEHVAKQARLERLERFE